MFFYLGICNIKKSALTIKSDDGSVDRTSFGRLWYFDATEQVCKQFEPNGNRDGNIFISENDCKDGCLPQ